MVATCCNAPMFLDFTPGHWLTLYRDRLPADAPRPQMRVMTKDRAEAARLPDDIPAYPGYPPSFIFRQLKAWAAMGFRRPKLGW